MRAAASCRATKLRQLSEHPAAAVLLRAFLFAPRNERGRGGAITSGCLRREMNQARPGALRPGGRKRVARRFLIGELRARGVIDSGRMGG